jgi:hypothetical protein
VLAGLTANEAKLPQTSSNLAGAGVSAETRLSSAVPGRYGHPKNEALAE